MQIRHEHEGDPASISRLIRAAFTGHPHHALGAEPIEPMIVEALRAAGALSLSLVAKDEEGIVGHIAFSEVLVGGIRVGWHGLGPVCVHPRRQRQGIGAMLVEQGIAAIRQRGARGIVLLGEPGYYGRFGFRADPSLVLEGVPAEYFLALPLGTPVPAGKVSYHAAFG